MYDPFLEFFYATLLEKINSWDFKMYTHKNVKKIENIAQKAGQGVSMQMLLSPDESPNFAMRRFMIEAGGFMPFHTNSVEAYSFLCLVPKGEDCITIMEG